MYSQSENIMLGIFDVSNPIIATSKTSLIEADGFGESFYKTEKLPNGKLKVLYTFNKSSLPNPLFINYYFQIEGLPSGDFAMDMSAAMPPTSLYIDTNTVKLSYKGDKINLPNYPTQNKTLTDIGGVFSLKRIVTNDIFLIYNISITNRQFAPKEKVILNGEIYEVYKYTYSFVQKTFLKDNILLSERQDSVEETYVAGHGLVNQKRQGKLLPANIIGGKISNQTIISELLKIQ